MRLIQLAKAAMLAGCVTMAGSVALQAKTVQLPPPNCISGTSSTPGVDVWNSTACINQIGGNDSDSSVGNGVTNVNTAAAGGGGLFGFSNWTLNSRFSTSPGSNVSGILVVSGNSTGMLGNWRVSSWAGIGAAMLVIKGGNGFVSYLLDMTTPITLKWMGGWSTQALRNGGGNIPAISHISLYTTPGAPAAVPVPAAGLLLMGALGGLAALRGKKRKA